MALSVIWVCFLLSYTVIERQSTHCNMIHRRVTVALYSDELNNMLQMQNILGLKTAIGNYL